MNLPCRRTTNEAKKTYSYDPRLDPQLQLTLFDTERQAIIGDDIRRMSAQEVRDHKKLPNGSDIG